VKKICLNQKVCNRSSIQFSYFLDHLHKYLSTTPSLGTVFAYGQTSSGKTHTMMGGESDAGVIPLSITRIFEYIQEVRSNCSG